MRGGGWRAGRGKGEEDEKEEKEEEKEEEEEGEGREGGRKNIKEEIVRH